MRELRRQQPGSHPAPVRDLLIRLRLGGRRIRNRPMVRTQWSEVLAQIAGGMRRSCGNGHRRAQPASVRDCPLRKSGGVQIVDVASRTDHAQISLQASNQARIRVGRRRPSQRDLADTTTIVPLVQSPSLVETASEDARFAPVGIDQACNAESGKCERI